jgi:hypothetical protein
MANNWYISSVGYAAVTPWAASAAVTVGMIRRQLATPTFGNERCFRCTTAGTTGASAPAWNLGYNTTTNDGTAVWTEITGQEAYQSPGNWAAPHAHLATLSQWGGANHGDTFYLAKNHAETRADGSDNNATLLGKWEAPCYWSAGASIAAASSRQLGMYQFTANASVYLFGLTLKADKNIVTADFICHSIYDQCNFVCTSASGDDKFLQAGGTDVGIKFLNCTYKFLKTTQYVEFMGNRITFIGGSIDATGSLPNYFFHLDAGGIMDMIGFDATNLASGKALVAIGSQGMGVMRNCKLGAGVLACVVNAFGAPGPDGWLYVERTSASGVNYNVEKYHGYATETRDITVARTGGATDLTTPESSKIAMVTGAGGNPKAFFDSPYDAIALPAWSDTTGADVTVTLYGMWDQAALPTNADIFLDVDYAGSALTPINTRKTTKKANRDTASTALTADTSAWDSKATARANSTTYANGDTFKVASNPGRVFVVTSGGGGASAGSIPGGYAAMADGDAIVDGALTVRALWRFKIVLILTSPQPAMKGPLYTMPRVTTPGAVVWFDPLSVLT